MDLNPLVMAIMLCASYLLLVRAYSLYFSFNGHLIDIPRDFISRPKVSVLLPCFNESQAIYDTVKSIAESDYPKDQLEIFVIDDCSKDDTWAWVQKAAKDFPSVVGMKNEINLGKPATMIKLSKMSAGEILIGTDGDTIWHKDAIKELVSCFKDPLIGGVAGVCGVYNVNNSLLTQFQTIKYAIGFYLTKPIENITRTIQCLPGPVIAFRAHVYKDLLVPELEKRNFLGARIQHGEDRFATQMILAHGYKTFLNFDAKVWSSTPVTWSNFMNQQMRWRRSVIQSWVDTTFNFRKRLRTGGTFTVINCLLPALLHFAMFVFPFYLAWQGRFLPILIRTMILLVIPSSIMIGLVLNMFFKRTDPHQILKNPILSMIIFGIWAPVSFFFITPFALLTLDDSGWVTRQNGKAGNV